MSLEGSNFECWGPSSAHQISANTGGAQRNDSVRMCIQTGGCRTRSFSQSGINICKPAASRACQPPAYAECCCISTSQVKVAVRNAACIALHSVHPSLLSDCLSCLLNKLCISAFIHIWLSLCLLIGICWAMTASRYMWCSWGQSTCEIFWLMPTFCRRLSGRARTLTSSK